MRLRRLAAPLVIAAGFALGLTVPASASDNIVIANNGGALATRAAVYPGERLTHGGIGYDVVTARCSFGTCLLTLTPQLPASDSGQELVFAALS